jgi:cell fate regulator YaaT (PSP1 superfamily)
VYFTSEERIDFRALVRDLARLFRTRIEMKQIGVRDEAKMLDGIGKCGRRLCCSSWLREFNPVSIKMAKQQDLPLNPSDISGVCGRLLCCLGYEMNVYAETRQRLPKVGAEVVTPEGPGRVRQVHTLREMVTVRLEDGTLVELPAANLVAAQGRSLGRNCGSCEECSAVQSDDDDDGDDSDQQVNC